MIHLRSLLWVQPATNTGQVTAAWGEIEAGLSRGMKLREVWEAAKLDGLEIPYCLQLVESGRIPSVPVGCRRRMDVVEQWLAAGGYRPPETHCAENNVLLTIWGRTDQSRG